MGTNYYRGFPKYKSVKGTYFGRIRKYIGFGALGAGLLIGLGVYFAPGLTKYKSFIEGNDFDFLDKEHSLQYKTRLGIGLIPSSPQNTSSEHEA